MYNIGTVFSAQNLSDAIRALIKDPEALVLAGGTSLLVNIKGGNYGGRNLVSVIDIPELKGISTDNDGNIIIGSCTTLNEVCSNSEIQKRLPALARAAKLVGGPQTRNLATIGGNICTGYMSADTSIALLALNAHVELLGPNGTRIIALESFFTKPTRVDLMPGELLVNIKIRNESYVGYGGHYEKHSARKALDFALLNCAAQVKLDNDRNKITALGLAFGVVAPKPLRCHQAEQMAVGMSADKQTIELVLQEAIQEAKPCKDCWRASQGYRFYLMKKIGSIALEQAIANAKEVTHA